MFAERLYVMRKNFKILSEKSKKDPIQKNKTIKNVTITRRSVLVTAQTRD
jgi:hypothetical protein